MGFLPVNKIEMLNLGWSNVDFVFVSGDAYVDHPSFGHAIITRVLESKGFKVGILSQPDWHNIEAFKEFGRPHLGFLVSAGNIDSMVNHYTTGKKPRSNDVYSPGGKPKLRPDRATIVYCNCIKSAYKKVPIAIGGIEASLRRFAHYDYWDDRVRASILQDSGADLLIYGMGERIIIDLAEALNSGMDIKDITFIDGTCYMTDKIEKVCDYIKIESLEDVQNNKVAYAKAFMTQYDEQDAYRGHRIVQPHGKMFLVSNPPAKPLERNELDRTYSLPYERAIHPMYVSLGGVPAIQEVEFSITSNRGCFGGCSFCALTFHQGRTVTSRSHQSIITEAKKITDSQGFKGYIHDIGGPTANFRNASCSQQKKIGTCVNKQCLFPQPCPNLDADHSDYLKLLREIRVLPKIKKVFIRSGVRFDYILADKKYGQEFLSELCEHHVSGQLKVAPEHVSQKVLRLMGKPDNKVYERFAEAYKKTNERLGKKQYLVPYLISSHPGSDLSAAIELAEYLNKIGHMPEQVQDFYPTPGTLSTCMYFTGLDPRTMKPVYIPKDPHEKAMQRALLQFRRPENYSLINEALTTAGRQDLIGFDKKCLIRPRSVRTPNQARTTTITRKLPQKRRTHRQ